jgi:hypothetical protein
MRVTMRVTMKKEVDDIEEELRIWRVPEYIKDQGNCDIQSTLNLR